MENDKCVVQFNNITVTQRVKMFTPFSECSEYPNETYTFLRETCKSAR